VRLTLDEIRVLADGSAARLLDAEDRYGSQAAALAAHPDLTPVARQVQRLRAKASAARRGVELELGGDLRPLAPDVLAEARRTFQQIVTAEAHGDPLVQIPLAAGPSGAGDDDGGEETP
jgi:hypothetical protein